MKNIIIPDYVIIKILRYLIQDKNNNNNNDNYNNSNYNKYKPTSNKKTKYGNSNSSLNLSFNYATVCWKWFKLGSKLNYFLPRRYLVSLINRNTKNDEIDNNFYKMINNHFKSNHNTTLLQDEDSTSDEDEEDNSTTKELEIEKNLRINSNNIFYTSLKYGWIQFSNLVEIEFDCVISSNSSLSWYQSWQLLVRESPSIQRVSLVIIVGNDNPIEIFERFPLDSDITLSLKLYFNELYCNLESIEHFTTSKRLPQSLSVDSIQCICNIQQDMNWDIVNFFKPSKLLLDSSYETTFHYSYSELFNYNNGNNSNNNNNNNGIMEFKIKSHDFMDFQDFRVALENKSLIQMDCSLLLFDLHNFEHINPEIGSEQYWNSMSCDTNDHASTLYQCCTDIALLLANNSNLKSLKISDYFRSYEDDDNSIYEGYDENNTFFDKPTLQLSTIYSLSSTTPSTYHGDGIFDPFQDTQYNNNELLSTTIKSFSNQFSESILKNKTLTSLYISSWDSLLSIPSYFFNAISINSTITQLSLVNDTISDMNIELFSNYFIKNKSIESLNLSNNKLKQIDQLVILLNSISTREIKTIINLSNNNYLLKFSNHIYKCVSANSKYIHQIILPINFKVFIEQLNDKNKFNISFF